MTNKNNYNIISLLIGRIGTNVADSLFIWQYCGTLKPILIHQC